MNSQINDEAFDILLKQAFIDVEKMQIKENEKIFKKYKISIRSIPELSSIFCKMFHKVSFKYIKNTKLTFKIATWFIAFVIVGYFIINADAAKSNIITFFYKIYETHFMY